MFPVKMIFLAHLFWTPT